jgi:magnesium chelatase accessory protein
MADRLNWERDGHDWPHREHSRFVHAAGLQWHVQAFPPPGPDAPLVLLLHGTGASTHSWRDVAPVLAQRFAVLACDLPGHGFTDMPAGDQGVRCLSLVGMAACLGELLRALAVSPALLVGHSAGAALALRMVLDGAAAPRAVVGINAALLPLRGLPGQLFAPAARLMAAAPVVPRLFAWRAANPGVLRRLVASTGSTLDAQGLAWYGRLVRNPGHAAGALGMMAHWDLPALARDLPRLATPLHLLVGTADRTVSPREAPRVERLLAPQARRAITRLEGLGHLAHEEQPAQVAALVQQCFDQGLAP